MKYPAPTMNAPHSSQFQGHFSSGPFLLSWSILHTSFQMSSPAPTQAQIRAETPPSGKGGVRTAVPSGQAVRRGAVKAGDPDRDGQLGPPLLTS